MIYASVQTRSDLPPGQNIEHIKLRCSLKRARRSALSDAFEAGMIDTDHEEEERANLTALLERQGYVTDGTRTITVVEVQASDQVDLLVSHDRGVTQGLTLLVIEVIHRTTNERGFMFSVRAGGIGQTIVRKNGEIEDTIEEAEVEGKKALEQVIEDGEERRRRYG